MLELLTADGRRPVAELAREVSLSRTAVRARLARLRRDGVIAGFTVVRGDEAGGTRAILLVEIAMRPCARVLAALACLPGVTREYSLAGPDDALAHVTVGSPAALSRLVDDATALRGVRRVQSRVVLSADMS